MKDKEQEKEIKETGDKVLKINLKTFIIIAIIVAIVIVSIITLVIRKSRIKKEKDRSEKEYIEELLDIIAQNDFGEKESIEFSDFVEKVDFVQKTFNKKYMDLYSIVKGSEKTIKGITFAYRNEKVNSCIKNAIYNGLTDLDIESKLNVIYNESKIHFSVTKQEINELIKKYYGIEEKEEYPETLELVLTEKSYANLKLGNDTYSTDCSYGLINSIVEKGKTIDTTSYTLGLLDEVQDDGDTIILKEKIIEVQYYKDYTYLIEDPINSNEICKVNESNKFNIAKYYNNLGCYEYVFKKNENGYYLSEIAIDLNTIDRTDIINNLKERAKETNSKIYLIDLDKEILGEEFQMYEDVDIDFSQNGEFSAYLGWGNSVSGTYRNSNNIIKCTINTFYGQYSPRQKTSAEISFKISDDSTIEVISASKGYNIKTTNYNQNNGNWELTEEEKEMSLYPFVKGAKFSLINNIDLVSN